ncbi:cell wall-binding repeat-containing protein [Herbiconiux liukaitaii]|uniref:cell wall-binding repeat-containing protein n=1 Tax=Herbiconiux liukaitaii TaxID=3342799 RepID=UPI0035B86211
MSHTRRGALLVRVLSAVVAGATIFAIAGPAPGAAVAAGSFVPISGTGSTWSQGPLDRWRKDVAVDFGMTVNYAGVGSSAGRRDFVAQTVDFAVSEMPFQSTPEDGSASEVPSSTYAYLPLVAGGTALAYHLTGSDGVAITTLRLSEATVAGIFTGSIRSWNDAAIVADNPGAALPAKTITPVVRADGNGSTWQFTSWLKARQPDRWAAICTSAACAPQSQFPVQGDMKAQNGSLGVAGYVSQGYGEGAITYVENSYALASGLPVAKVLNAGGYYVAPTPAAVSIALLGAEIDEDTASERYGTLELGAVYSNPDPRAYPLSSTSYMIVPTETNRVFREEKGASLTAFGQYALCAGQGRAAGLGNAALPLNLVQHGISQLALVPGSGGGTGTPTLAECANPTFVNGDTVNDSVLTRTTPMPPASDRAGGPVADSWPPVTERVSGADRYEAAVNASRAAFPGTAPVVYVVTGSNYPDALSAGPAAAVDGGPLLLTDTNTLLPAVSAEIKRLRPGRIVVVGGPNSVSPAVFDSLRAVQSDTVRISGTDRYEASRNLAMYAFGASRASTAYVATGANFPDALSAGAAAASARGPVVLVNGSASAPDTTTLALLGSLGVTTVKVAGGPASVSTGVETGLRTAGLSVTRLGGADRFAASVSINADAFERSDRAFLVTGLKFADALAGSAWAGKLSAPLYVAHADCVPGAALAAMKAQGVERVTLIGGPASLDERVAALTACG